MKTFEVYPLVATPERAQVVSTILRKLAAYDTVFNDAQRGCEEGCLTKPLGEMCPRCVSQLQLISSALLAPDTRVFEVWKFDDEEAEIVGVIYFTDVVPGEDALGHYIFFDHDLASKTDVMKEVISWAFEDHPEEGWKGLRRISVEIPMFAFILAKHASKKLGFGGPFWLRRRGLSVPVEGLKEGRILWKGKEEDVMLMGLRRPRG